MLCPIRALRPTLLAQRQGTSPKEHTDHVAALSQVVLPSILARIEGVDLGTIISCLKTVTTHHAMVDGSKQALLHEPFCVALLYSLFRRADPLLGAPTTKPEQQQEWCSLVEIMVGGTAEALGKKIKSAGDQGQYLWEYANITSAHSGQPGRAKMRAHLGGLLPDGHKPPFMELFMTLTTPAPVDSESG